MVARAAVTNTSAQTWFMFLGQTTAGRRMTAEAEQEQLIESVRSGMLVLKMTAP